MTRSAKSHVRILAWLIALPAAGPADADIDLELRPDTQTSDSGEVVSVGLYAVSDDPIQNQLSAAMRVFIGWDPVHLQLVGLDQSGATPLLTSRFPFPDELYNVNESDPPQDGDAYYQALAPLGNRVVATPAGTLITTFRLQALEPTAMTTIEILTSAGDPVGHTTVLDGTIPNLDVTGTLSGASVAIEPACPGDTNDDGVVNVTDLVNVILAWDTDGQQVPGVDADVVGDGIVDVQDLVAIIIAWGPCP